MADSILIEARPRLKSCNISIKLRQNKEVNVKVIDNCLSVGEQQFIFKDIAFEPSNVDNVVAKGEFTSFNVKLASCAEKSMKKWSLQQPVLAGIPVNLSCRCSRIIAENIVFERVLPMPSSHWETADVFCHGHLVEKRQKFRDGDCLYATHFFHLSENILKDPVCPKCNVVFGKKLDGFYKIWTSSVEFTPSVECRNELSDFEAILHEVFFSPMVIFARILLQSDRSALTITVIEKDVHVMQYEHGQDMGEIPAQLMLKVEYCYHAGTTEPVQNWQKDTSVHNFEVPEILLQTVRKHLDDVHHKIHPNFDKIEDRLLSYVQF